MDIQRAEANRGIAWIQIGWAAFVRLPGMWILLMVVLLAIVVVLNLLPWVGSLIVALITPLLAAGVLEAARRSTQGEDFALGALFESTTRSEVLNNLLVLGAVSLIINVVIMALGLVFIGGSALGMGMMHGEEGAWMGFGAGALLVFPLMLILHVALSAALFFAIPLVMDEKAPPLQAMQDSLKACLVNWVPLLLFGIIATILGALAIIPMGLGFLVLGPVLAGAVWAAYREVFGPPAAPIDAPRTEMPAA